MIAARCAPGRGAGGAVMRHGWMGLVGLGLILVLGQSAPAQMPGPFGGTPPAGPMGPPAAGGAPGGGAGPFGLGGAFRAERGDRDESQWQALLFDQRAELGLTPEQEQGLRDLRTEQSKDWIRRTADVQVAEIELDALLEREAWDAVAIEAKARQVEGLKAERRVSRLKSLIAARALLTPEQRERLTQLRERRERPGGLVPSGAPPGGPFQRPGRVFQPGMAPSPFPPGGPPPGGPPAAPRR